MKQLIDRLLRKCTRDARPLGRNEAVRLLLAQSLQRNEAGGLERTSEGITRAYASYA